MISMLEQLYIDSSGCGCTRPVWFIHAARNSDVQAFGGYIRKLGQEFSCLTTHIRYSNPSATDAVGEHYDSAGYVDEDLLKSLLPPDDYDFYLCGPTPFMESVYEALKNLNISDERINYEFFGSGATLGNKRAKGSLIADIADQGPVTVEFARSGIQATWDPSKGSLLDLAESEGLQPAYSCRSGVCQTCAIKITQGDVAYIEQPMVDPGECTALICSAYPQPGTDTDGNEKALVLDL